MQIRIPKSAIFPLVVATIVVGWIWLGRGGGEQEQEKFATGFERPTQARVQGSVSQGPLINGKQEVREIAVTAKQFQFAPNPIRVKLGELVRLKITSVDVTHGFSLPEFGINQVLEPGKTVTVQFQATRKGEFAFACSVACGEGHSGMRGKLIVE